MLLENIIYVITRRISDAKRQREAAIFRCSCRNKKKEHLNSQTTVDGNTLTCLSLKTVGYFKLPPFKQYKDIYLVIRMIKINKH